jgi:flagellar hook-basal body complex protein FliE
MVNSIPNFSVPRPTIGPAANAVVADNAANLGAVGEGQSSSFKDMLLNSIGEVNSLQQDANQAVEKLATGGDVNPAEVLSAVQKADIAFRLMMQVRNKLVQAYEDVQQIRV